MLLEFHLTHLEEKINTNQYLTIVALIREITKPFHYNTDNTDDENTDNDGNNDDNNNNTDINIDDNN